MSNLADIRALLIEPHSGMRVSLHNMLNLCGIIKIEHAISAGTALRAIQAKNFDLVLCEYDLGVGQDGQQLLEDVRHHKLMPLSTIFIMVTAERAYAKVVGAAELAPSDYLLKPFTADMLLERVNKAFEKRYAFTEVHALLEQGAVREAIEACTLAEVAFPRYAIDFMRIRAELHVTMGDAAEAEELYARLFETKAVAWARLGLAKTLFMQGRYQEAEGILTSLVTENSKYMDAYDWLSKTHEAIGELPEAKSVLDSAVAVSPHAVRRLRKLGSLSLATGDIEGAESVLKKVVSKAKFSEFRDPEDHVNLVQALVKKGDHGQAQSVIRDLEKSMAGIKKTEACRAISAAMVHASTGDERLADELDKAVLANREDVGLSNDIKLNLAKSCLENNQDGAASEVIMDVLRNSPNKTMVDRALGVFESAGKGFLGRELVQQSENEVKQLVALGVKKAKEGDFRGSVELMASAARKSPENPQVLLNAALAALKCIENCGWDLPTGKLAKQLIEAVARIDPMNTRLRAIRGLYEDLQKRFGISSVRTPAVKA
ncbi:MAG: tetratricopeptide repeat protein [Undibacterium sp.]|nr:tetratricopeptide repeat protein [Undibacterium sp.]